MICNRRLCVGLTKVQDGFKAFWWLSILVWISLTRMSSGQNITTVAGGGIGDGNVATDAMLNNPVSISVDGSGNIYIADQNNNRVRKVNVSSGIITTVAGTGGSSSSGDNGPATSATLNQPAGVCVDGSGNIYITESSGYRVRKVDTSGTITTVAGGNYGFAGDGGPATSASLARPSEIFVDGTGNLFIVDQGNHRIRKVDTSGTISTVAGNGTAGFSGDGGLATSASLNNPDDVSVDGSGNIYIADRNNNRIRKVDASSGIITTVAGTGTFGSTGDGGSATSATLSQPSGVFVDGSGNIYITEFFGYRVRKVDTSGTITTVAGGSYGSSGDGGLATNATLSTITDVFVDGSGNIYIADLSNARIRKVDTSNTINTVAGGGGLGDGSLATNASLNQPNHVFVDGSGNIYIADKNQNRIRKVDASTGIITTVAGGGSANPGDGGLATSAVISAPHSVFVDGSGNIYIGDNNTRIRKVDASSGIISTVAGGVYSGFAGDGGLATSARMHQRLGVFVDGSGNIYIVDRNNHRIRKVDASTGIINTIAGNGTMSFAGDGGLATSASLAYPADVFVDGSGNIYIADANNNRIRKINASTSIITTVAGGGSAFPGDGGLATDAILQTPEGVFVDGSGNIYIADTNSDKIRKVDASTGIITTVAGNGSGNFAGDGGLATSASLKKPTGVFVDGSGNIYIADRDNNRIRKVAAPSLTESTVATGLSGGITATSGQETAVFKVGITGDGTSTLNSITLQFQDLSTSTSLSQTDFSSLKLYWSTDATLDGSDTQIGTLAAGSINIGGNTVISPSATETPPSGAERFYIISATIGSGSTGGHAFKVGFAAGGVTTSVGGKGTAVTASDANKITISNITETTTATGLSGASMLSSGGEVKILSIGLTGDGIASVSAVTLTISDLSTPTGLVAGDFSQLRLYRSSDATLDGGDTQIGSQSTVNIGSPTTISATTADVPPSGTETFYLVSAVLSSTVGHAFKVGFAAGGVTTNVGGKGTAITASDANKVIIAPAVPTLADFTGLSRPPFRPTLDWNDINGAATYSLEYADNSGFTNSTTVTGLTTSEYTFPSSLSDGTYYWRVKGVGAGGEESAYSSADSFVIIPTFTEWGLVLLVTVMMAYMVWHSRKNYAQ